MKPCRALLAALFLVATCMAQQEAPSAWQAAADDFVQQVLSRSGSPSTINVSFGNLSSLSSGEQDSIKRTILTSFRNAGVRLVKPELALAEVDITFSEDWQNYVWVAAIRQGPGNQVVIKSVPRPPRAAGYRATTLTIKRNVVWQQDGPILDFYVDGQNLYVLDPGQITLYANDSGKWRVRQTLAISHERPWPRDLRARLQVSGLQLSAFFPGTFCNGASSPPALQCRASDDPWQVDQNLLVAFFSPARNFFTGVLSGQSSGDSVPAFFSAAARQNGSSRQWVFAGVDGRARIYLNSLASPAITISDWGSNLAAVQSSCGTGWQVLVSAPGDLTRSDSVQAFEIEGRDAMPASSPADLSGPVLAFWPDDNGQSAHAVVQSLATGKYEAVNVTVGCNQ